MMQLNYTKQIVFINRLYMLSYTSNVKPELQWLVLAATMIYVFFFSISNVVLQRVMEVQF